MPMVPNGRGNNLYDPLFISWFEKAVRREARPFCVYLWTGSAIDCIIFKNIAFFLT